MSRLQERTHVPICQWAYTGSDTGITRTIVWLQIPSVAGDHEETQRAGLPNALGRAVDLHDGCSLHPGKTLLLLCAQLCQELGDGTFQVQVRRSITLLNSFVGLCDSFVGLCGS